MIKYIYIVFFLVLTETVLSQDGLSYSVDSDTSFWYAYKNDLLDEFGLRKIELDESGATIFRIFVPGAAIEFSKYGSQLHGKIDFLVNEYSEFGRGKIFKRVYSLENTSNAVFELIDSSQVNSIPSEKYIPSWQQGLDGFEFLIEFKTDTTYSFKSYWSPWTQEGLYEAKVIQAFVDRLLQICEYERLQKELRQEIPFKSYTFAGAGVIFTTRECKSMRSKDGRRNSPK